MKNLIEIKNSIDDLEAKQTQLKRICEMGAIYEMITHTTIQGVKKIENKKVKWYGGQYVSRYIQLEYQREKIEVTEKTIHQKLSGIDARNVSQIHKGTCILESQFIWAAKIKILQTGWLINNRN